MSNIGRLLYGYCNGYFGGGYYSLMRIEAEGVDWVVARDTGSSRNSPPMFAGFDNQGAEKQTLIDAWAKKPDDWDV